ncbi:hypothetical protein DW352_14280 [Pseudolabrys taiwanensis]|uniref:Uncharacterized protein n=1 Tax=Pseudolabrys taiwanensis TaxID=331696 RepID=A0A345ZXD6_9HYPH|nr:hypothetical protein [Pseudolabrys taiwanensis]AXK81583.1 hypothetical protein DW352_14280 [Pseudolabrys taiwanensis]
MKGALPEFPCLESRLFQDWTFNGGSWHNGPRKGELIPVKNTAPGQIVILTTRRPDQSEGERQIIGAYEIGKIDAQYNLTATPNNRIRLTKQQSELLPFWRYFRNAKPGMEWKTGLFRYLKPEQVHTILTDMATVCGETRAGAAAEALLVKHFSGTQPAPPAGALKGKLPAGKEAAIARKYPGGEGPDHLALKEWVAHNPAAVGLPRNSKYDLEHLFTSGDCVDILFTLPTGQFAVVEIETRFPFPGAHQAIKYRALQAAARSWRLSDNRVTAILVAWDFDASTLQFCRRYNIETWKCRSGSAGTRIKTQT